MIDEPLVEKATEFVRQVFSDDASGHDAHHTLRVYRLARRIATEEGADAGIVSLAALLHDVDDHKISPETHATLARARAFMEEQGLSADEVDQVLVAIREVSFSENGDRPPSSPEAACVRDADRLDAIGAIGIARAFAFGGAHGRSMHNPDADDASTTISHFHDKLLLLADMMCTDAGRRLAKGRDATLRRFLDDFMAEWDGLR